MKLNENLVCCADCRDVDRARHVPIVEADPGRIRMAVISEAAPRDLNDYFYQPGTPEFLRTTNLAFADAGYSFATARDYLRNGIYLTTAIKCGKKRYQVSSATLKNCSAVLAEELGQFKNLRVLMLMGDFAIRCVNHIWKAKYGVGVLPPGATYKIRSGVYEHGGLRFFPSYTQTGDSFNLEKSKRRMIAEDIKQAMGVLAGD